MTFYERLKMLMKETGTTQKQLTELGINKNSFKYWKENGNIPKGDILSKLASYFNVSVPYLIGLTDIKNGAVPTEQPLTPIKEEAINIILDLPDSAVEDWIRFLDAYRNKNDQ